MTDDLLTSLDRVIARARTIDEPILRAAREKIKELRRDKTLLLLEIDEMQRLQDMPPRISRDGSTVTKEKT